MNIRRLFHVLAIMLSSLVSMISHGHAQTDIVKKQKKNSDKELSKSHRHESEEANSNDDPPRKLNPTLLAALRNAPKNSMFSAPMDTIEFPARPPGHSAYNYPNAPTPETVTQTNTYTPATSTEATRYPWREKIVTTTFWIGEDSSKRNPVPNRASSWDAEWQTSYGGFDDPDPANRKEFIPVAFTPRQNPFYVALPYNDQLKHGFKPEASQVIPWFKSAYQGPDKSVCKGRWVAIRFKNRVVYAQWEDCGPFRTDHWEYVFGNDRPKPNMNHGAGLDVSPAVRDYLGMNDTDVTDWRFVEFDEVPQGPWSKLGDNNTFVINERTKTERLARAHDKMYERTTLE